jgi:hypothetical protein
MAPSNHGTPSSAAAAHTYTGDQDVSKAWGQGGACPTTPCPVPRPGRHQHPTHHTTGHGGHAVQVGGVHAVPPSHLSMAASVLNVSGGHTDDRPQGHKGGEVRGGGAWGGGAQVEWKPRRAKGVDVAFLPPALGGPSAPPLPSSPMNPCRPGALCPTSSLCPSVSLRGLLPSLCPSVLSQPHPPFCATPAPSVSLRPTLYPSMPPLSPCAQLYIPVPNSVSPCLT